MISLTRTLSTVILTFFLFSSFHLSATTYHSEYEKHEKEALLALPQRYRKWISQQSITLTPLKKKSKRYDKGGSMKDRFKIIKKISSFIALPALFGIQKEHIHKNRSLKRIPYDATRTLRHIKGFYYNANDVVTPLQKYIVCEAPLDHTLHDFWKMIVEAQSKNIVTLVTPYEKHKYNMAEFWSSQHLPYIVEGKWIIKKKSEEIIHEKWIRGEKRLMPHRIILRTFSVSPLSQGVPSENPSDERTIRQFHYWNWPDRGVPDTDLLLSLFDLIEAQNKTELNESIVVHCAAGVGRSGTFVASHSLLNEMKLNSSSPLLQPSFEINLSQRILGLRRQRHKMVSNAKQYNAILDALLKGASSQASK